MSVPPIAPEPNMLAAISDDDTAAADRVRHVPHVHVATATGIASRPPPIVAAVQQRHNPRHTQPTVTCSDDSTDDHDRDHEPLIVGRYQHEHEQRDGRFPRARHILGLMGFLGFANVYAMRVNLSVAVVAMVNHTAIPSIQNASLTDVCPVPADGNSTVPNVSDNDLFGGRNCIRFYVNYSLLITKIGVIVRKYVVTYILKPCQQLFNNLIVAHNNDKICRTNERK